jgi:hypothetical protein
MRQVKRLLALAALPFFALYLVITGQKLGG